MKKTLNENEIMDAVEEAELVNQSYLQGKEEEGHISIGTW